MNKKLYRIGNSVVWALLLVAWWVLGKRGQKPASRNRYVKAEIIGAFLEERLGKVHIRLLDPEYYIPTYKEVKDFLIADKTDRIKYSKHIDCENFAQILEVMASLKTKFHLLYGESKSHGYNHSITWEKGGLELRTIEPQSDEEWITPEPKNENKMYQTKYVEYR